jgi:hypothetical protein
MSDRRWFLSSLFVSLAASAIPSAARTRAMIVHKDPNCGCCDLWVEHVRAAGIMAEIVETKEINRAKARLGVPMAIASCHTAEIDGYVIEGHVPATEILRLLEKRPAARGLAVPGMPINSPGMEVAGAVDEAYDVLLFGAGEPRIYASYRGARRL